MSSSDPRIDRPVGYVERSINSCPLSAFKELMRQTLKEFLDRASDGTDDRNSLPSYLTAKINAILYAAKVAKQHPSVESDILTRTTQFVNQHRLAKGIEAESQEFMSKFLDWGFLAKAGK